MGDNEFGREFTERDHDIRLAGRVFFGEEHRHALDMVGFGKAGKVEKFGEQVDPPARDFDKAGSCRFPGHGRGGYPLVIGVEHKHARNVIANGFGCLRRQAEFHQKKAEAHADRPTRSPGPVTQHAHRFSPKR